MPESQSGDDLYALDPREFITARNALVKRLKSQGQADRAVTVAALRKPPLTAWALNQMARNDKSLVEDLLRCGRQLNDAMSQTLAGDRSGFAEAREAERRAIEAGVDTATHYLEGAGRPPRDDARQKMTETLRSATIDGDAADLLRRGVLDDDKAAVGFGFGPFPSPGREEEESRRTGRSAPSRQKQAAKRQERQRKRLTTEIDQLREKARLAHRAADEASREAGRRVKQAAAADERVNEAEQRLQALDHKV